MRGLCTNLERFADLLRSLPGELKPINSEYGERESKRFSLAFCLSRYSSAENYKRLLKTDDNLPTLLY